MKRIASVYLAKPIKMCVIVCCQSYLLIILWLAAGTEHLDKLLWLIITSSKQLSLYLLDIEAKNINPNTQYINSSISGKGVISNIFNQRSIVFPVSCMIWCPPPFPCCSKVADLHNCLVSAQLNVWITIRGSGLGA